MPTVGALLHGEVSWCKTEPNAALRLWWLSHLSRSELFVHRGSGMVKKRRKKKKLSLFAIVLIEQISFESFFFSFNFPWRFCASSVFARFHTLLHSHVLILLCRLERGGTFVQANIRGGGEFGPAWHAAALRDKRHKAYEDMEAVSLRRGRIGVVG